MLPFGPRRRMGVQTRVVVLSLVCTGVLVQISFYFHSYGYNYSEVRNKNRDESIWKAPPHKDRVPGGHEEQGMVDTLRGYGRDIAYLLGGANSGSGDAALIDSGKVIIYAKYRTGSTFISQFFFKHRNISYMFEPLRLGHNKPNVSELNGILWDMLQCKFETNRTDRILSWWMDRVVFCQITGQTPGCVHGESVSLARARQHCNNASIKVVKVIRIQNIWQLGEFLQQQVPSSL